MKVRINEATQPVIVLGVNEQVLITFDGDDRNLLIELTTSGVRTSWSRSKISPTMAAAGWEVVPGSERDYADLVERSSDPNLPDL